MRLEDLLREKKAGTTCRVRSPGGAVRVVRLPQGLLQARGGHAGAIVADCDNNLRVFVVWCGGDEHTAAG